MRTGWRFVWAGASGTYVRDPEGTDRLPPDYLSPPEWRERDIAPEISEVEWPPVEERLVFAASVRQTVYEMFGGGPPVGERTGSGECDDCGRPVSLREVFGRVRNVHGNYRERELCLDCVLRRRAAAVLEGVGGAGPAPVWTGWRREGDRLVRDPQGVDHPPLQRRKPPAPDWCFWREVRRQHADAGEGRQERSTTR